MIRQTRNQSAPTLEQLEDRLAPGGAGSPHSLIDLKKAEEDALLQVVQTLNSVGVTPPAAATDSGNSNPGVVPIQAKFEGKTYGQWSAAFWQWSYSLPVDNHPLLDTADVSTGQTGHVWFLGGTLAPTTGPGGDIIARVTRTVKIPSGTALFIPLVNAEASTVEGNGTTDAELREAAKGFADSIDPASLFAQVDGKSLTGLAGYRVQSPLYTFGPLPDNNVLQSFGVDAPAGTISNSVADGYQLLLEPLSVGQHTLHFGGNADIGTSDQGAELKFIQDITYNITVVPHSDK
jgi:hypothetical protein